MINLKKFLIFVHAFIIIFLVVGCTDIVQEKREAEEFAIYSLLINDICENNGAGEITTFIISETYYELSDDPYYDTTPKFNFLVWLDDMLTILREPSISKKTLNDYRAINHQSIMLSSTLIPEGKSCSLISSSELASLIEEKDFEWFNTHTLIKFSRIGFNTKLNQAFLYREYDCGGECAGGDYYFLVRINNVWSIEAIISGWNS